MITLMKKENITTETYHIHDEYYLDIVDNKERNEYASYIWNECYGTKQLIVEMSSKDISKAQFINSSLNEIFEDIHYYKMTIEDPEVKKYENKRENNNNKN